MIGHRTRFRGIDDLLLWRGQAAKKKPPFFNALALITCGCCKGIRSAILGNGLKEHGDNHFVSFLFKSVQSFIFLKTN